VCVFYFLPPFSLPNFAAFFWSFCLFVCLIVLAVDVGSTLEVCCRRRRRRLAWILASFLIFFFEFSGVQLLHPVFWTSSFCGYAVVAAGLKS
jgi:hypothetical protein